MSGKRFLTPEIAHTPFSLKSHMVNHIGGGGGGGGRGGLDTLVNVIHKQNGWRSFIMHVVVFKIKVLYYKIENTRINDTNGKKKFKRMLTFLFVDK